MAAKGGLELAIPAADAKLGLFNYCNELKLINGRAIKELKSSRKAPADRRHLFFAVSSAHSTQRNQNFLIQR